jgi:hypothetical protein
MAAASYGLQAGVQGLAYAMFFTTDSALSYSEDRAGFEIGVGPSVVVVDAGKAKTLTTTTGRDDVYAFIFGQKADGRARLCRGRRSLRSIGDPAACEDAPSVSCVAGVGQGCPRVN